MRKISIALLAVAALRFDHIWICVKPGAPERAALERAGFGITPDVSKHDGQGTASVSADFDDGYIELIWVDPDVNVAPGLERAVEKFRNRAAWRTSGWSPFGINLSRLKDGVDPVYPFPTWSVTAPWMEGSSILILTARDDTKSPSVSVHASATKQKGSHHPNGVHRITSVRIVSPRDYKPAPAVAYAKDIGVISLGTGDEWLAEVTFDNGMKKKTKDLRPDLPLLIHF